MKIAVLTGGITPEREVSLASGKAVVEALRSLGHTVQAFDPAYGADQPSSEDELFLAATHGDLPDEKVLTTMSRRKIIEFFNSSHCDDTEVVFLIIHGEGGEDGTIQALLEMKGIPYTGSGVLSSALAINKNAAKIVFQHHNILTPAWIIVPFSASADEFLPHAAALGEPLVVKPNVGGSTLGLSLVEKLDGDSLHRALQDSRRYSPDTLLERYIPGRELTVAVVGDKAFPVVEIVPEGGLYDYTHKYTKGLTKYYCPADLDAETVEALHASALKAFQVLGCRGFGRIDYRLSPEGTPYCLEVNSLPGMTATSLVPKSAAAEGISFPELCQMIIDTAK